MNGIAKFLLALALFSYAGNFVAAQELKKKTDYVSSPSTDSPSHSMEYNYYADELGYFEKYHGWQTDERPGENRFLKIQYDNGVPKQFVFSDLLYYKNPDLWETGPCFVESKGLYDAEGICYLSSKYEVHHDALHFEKTLTGNFCAFKAEDGNLLYFDSNVGGLSGKKLSESYDQHVFGSLDNESFFIIQKDSGSINSDSQKQLEKERGDLFMKNFIWFGDTLLLFDSPAVFDAFCSLGCKSLEEMEKTGFGFSDENWKYLKIKDDALIHDVGFMLASRIPAGLDTTDDIAYGFSNTPKKFGKIPSSCWFMELGLFKINVAGFFWPKWKSKVKVYYKVSKSSTPKQQEKALEFLSEEQYEKYKDRLVYVVAKRRHGVKKADGSYLYVSDEQEKQIVKTEAEIKKDEQEDKRLEAQRKDIKFLFDVQQKLRQTAEAVRNRPSFEEAQKKYNSEEYKAKVEAIVEKANAEKEKELAEKRRLEEEEKRKIEEGIFTVVPSPAAFPGGTSALREWVEKNRKNPPTRTAFGQATFKVVVNKDGSIQDIEVVDSPSAFIEEAKRLIMSMPKWLPAEYNGVPVRAYTTIKIDYQI